jgi:hypothetical protein
MIRERKKNIAPDLNDLYARWLIPKFSKLIKGSRLTPERIEKLIVGFITPQKRELLLAMLYNREITLIWEFSEMRKIKPKVSSSIMIRTVPYKVW